MFEEVTLLTLLNVRCETPAEKQVSCLSLTAQTSEEREERDMLVRVKKVPTNEFMSDKALKLVEKFNGSSCVLYLNIHPGYDLSTLDEEGMYDFVFAICDDEQDTSDDESLRLIAEMEEMFDALWSVARPVHFSKEDVVPVHVTKFYNKEDYLF